MIAEIHTSAARYYEKVTRKLINYILIKPNYSILKATLISPINFDIK